MPAQGPADGNKDDKYFVSILSEPTRITILAYPNPSHVFLSMTLGNGDPTEVTLAPATSPYTTGRERFGDWDWHLQAGVNSQQGQRNLYYYSVGSTTPIGTTPFSIPPTNTAQTLSATSTTAPTSHSTAQSTTRQSTVTGFPANTSAPIIRGKDDSGVAPGAVAGAAIGSLIAGALLAGLIMWFCLRKSRKSRSGRDQESSMLALVPGQEKGPAAKVVSLASASPVSRDINGILPQPLEDEAISSGFSGIGVAIKNHVQSFYHSSRVSPGLLDLDDLQRLGSDLPLSTGTLSTLLGNTDTREVALRFCIGWIVVSRMQLSSSPGTTLLPPEIADCFRSMVIGNHASQPQTSYLAHWRGLTAELLQSTYTKNSFTTSDLRLRSLENAINALDGILLPFADSRMDNTQRMQNLREILKRAATFAFTLFSQPSTYEFDWQGQQQGGLSEGLCVFPAFVQVTDESGETVRPPRVLSEAIVRNLD